VGSASGTDAERQVLDALERDATREAGMSVVDLVASYFDETRDERRGVSRGTHPAELSRRFDEPLPQEGRELDDVVARLASEVLPESIALTHPMYLGHQVSAPLPAAVWSDALVSALNQSVAVREMSPVATVIEHRRPRNGSRAVRSLYGNSHADTTAGWQRGAGGWRYE
jgi:L-2,4-diaminobutyrate decarboxylase